MKLWKANTRNTMLLAFNSFFPEEGWSYYNIRNFGEINQTLVKRFQVSINQFYLHSTKIPDCNQGSFLILK